MPLCIRVAPTQVALPYDPLETKSNLSQGIEVAGCAFAMMAERLSRTGKSPTPAQRGVPELPLALLHGILHRKASQEPHVALVRSFAAVLTPVADRSRPLVVLVD